MATLFQVSELCACAGWSANDVNAAMIARARKRVLLAARLKSRASPVESVV
jgi:hypothetical protein